MKFKLILSLVAIFITFSIIAQSGTSNENNNIDTKGNIEQYIVAASGVSDNSSDTTDGSPYLEETFNFGTIVEGNIFIQAYMRYNIFFNEIQLIKKRGSKDIFGLKKSTDLKAIIGGKTFVYSHKNSENQQGGTYYEVLYKGSKFDLYKQYSIKYLRPKVAVTTFDTDQPGRYSNSSTLYIVSKESGFMEIPKRRRQFLKILDKKTEEANSFLKKNRIDLTEDEDAEKFVSFYDKQFIKE